MQFEYHRLARSAPKYAWWKALVAGLIGLGIYLVLSIVVTVGWFVVRFATRPELLEDPALLAGDPTEVLRPVTEIDFTDPNTFVLLTLSVAVFIPAIFVARRLIGPRPVGLLASVTGRLRWRWLLLCSGLAAAAVAVTTGVQFLLPTSASTEAPPIDPVPLATSLLLVVLALLLVPFQAAAEEYVFRGYLMQAIGGWLKHPAWAILLPVPLFAAAHTQYGVFALTQVALLALVFGFLTWRTGGLEAAIALHVLNNLLAFLLGAFGLVDNSGGEGDILAVVFGVLLAGIYVGLVEWRFRRSGLVRTREATPDEPPMEHWAPPTPPEGWAVPTVVEQRSVADPEQGGSGSPAPAPAPRDAASVWTAPVWIAPASDDRRV